MWEVLKDLVSFMVERRKFWLVPIMIVMLFLGALIMLGESSTIAPFIYTIF